MRAKANTKSWRIMGESSTIRQEYSDILLNAQVQKRLEAWDPPFGLGEQAGAHERSGGMLTQKLEQLEVRGVEAGLLSERGEDGNHADDAIVDGERHDRRRLFEV